MQYEISLALHSWRAETKSICNPKWGGVGDTSQSLFRKLMKSPNNVAASNE